MPTMNANKLMAALDAAGDATVATHSQRFFKTGPGQYGEGDIFIGVRVPQTRVICREFADMSLDQIERVLDSPIHEHRIAGVIIMSEQTKRARKNNDQKTRRALYELYLRRADRINNWDLVDVSSPAVVGEYLLDKDSYSPLLKLAKADLLWERRIAIVSTLAFTRADRFEPVTTVSRMLINDSEDLMHKAVGWMLREAGKRDIAVLEQFLTEHAHELPRTALRYSIERMTPERRQYWMAAKAKAQSANQAVRSGLAANG